MLRVLSSRAGSIARRPQLLRLATTANFHSTPASADAAPKDNKLPSQLERFNRIVFMGELSRFNF